MPVQDTRQSDAEQDARGHDEGKDDGPKVLDRVKDEQLAYRAADAEHEKMQVDLGVLHDKGQGGRQFVRVDQRDGT